ncbi:MAG TPA: SsrA-binding protein SmpB [Leptospiraceae bacterium]|nr:SsrA-binding protein SmpB [Leptospiraceae bacterium]HMY69378.1 SsrA-binding protein SmpB [Leptospiraceae bacterium]HMZ58002.1 SsrA-binding protein SmpB [Leptospiraceae bacterium]HNF17215.1 SsrA-binding protein SmpB [Leptospiraceae bacterium]HNF27132.1 SsrA-binding protein SmpB [Leptospiraceae bacterium]
MSKKKEEKAVHTTGEITTNKKAKFNFELLETVEAGIILTGSEVKSLREKKANLTDAFARIRNGEVFLENFHITPYKNGGYANHAEVRSRKLLFKRKEILKLQKLVREKGLSLVAVKTYFNQRGFVKVLIASAKPKKLHDKRETVQKRESQIEINRAMKGRE